MDIKNQYTDPEQPGSYTSTRKFAKELKKRGHKVTEKKVEKILQGVDSYTLYKTARKTFPTRPVVSAGIDHVWGADLIVLSKQVAKANKGISYLLTVIDLFTRYAWVVPLKNKTGVSVVQGLKNILAERRCTYFWTDRGIEFRAKAVKEFLKDEGITHYYTNNPPKVSVVERFNKTIGLKMHKHMQKSNSWKILEDLPKLVHSYNHTIHSAIKMAPAEVNYDNEKQLWDAQQAKKQKRKSKYKYNIGQTVRISKQRHAFTRGYHEQFTQEIFWVEKRMRRQGFNLYELKDCSDQVIEGRFYEAELTPVVKQEDDLWKIDKILARKKRKGVNWVYVAWKNYPKECNSWIKESDIEDV